MYLIMVHGGAVDKVHNKPQRALRSLFMGEGACSERRARAT